MVSCNPSLNLTVFNQLHPLFSPKFQLVVPYIASLICENACTLPVDPKKWRCLDYFGGFNDNAPFLTHPNISPVFV